MRFKKPDSLCPGESNDGDQSKKRWGFQNDFLIAGHLFLALAVVLAFPVYCEAGLIVSLLFSLLFGSFAALSTERYIVQYHPYDTTIIAPDDISSLRKFMEEKAPQPIEWNV